MKLSDIPSQNFPVPFASSAGGGFIRPIPLASQIGITNGAASLTDGFPPLNFLPVGSGGVPPFGQDMNGLLNQITQWTKWANAGGLVKYNATFSGQIGGYPQGSVLAGTAAGVIYLSIVDDNVTNPNTGGAGWIVIGTSAAILNSSYSYAADTGTAAALVVTLAPVPTAYVTGMEILVKVANIATGAATINVNSLGAKAVVDHSGAPISAGFWQTADILSMVYDGTSLRVTGGNTTVSSTFTSSFATPNGLSNGVLTQTGLTNGSASFGAVASNQFTFTRTGFYAVSAQVGTSVTSSGATSIANGVAIKKNGTQVPGGNVQDNAYSGGSGTATLGAVVTVVISVAAGDIIQVFAQASANTGFTSASCLSATLSITPIS